MKSISEAEVADKKVIVRADLDLAENNGHLETFRMKRLVPTLAELISKGATVRIVAHRGRPDGVVDNNLSLSTFAPLIAELIGHEVVFGGDLIQNPDPQGQVILFENLRFNPGEESNSPDFVQALLKLGEIYVNEAFANSHRAHASMVALPKYLTHFAGLNLMEEVSSLSKVLNNPARPLVVVIGGIKMETKRPLIDYMQTLADEILVGQAFVNEGLPPLEKVVRPIDQVSNLDIGTLTIERFKQSLSQAKTTVWNGPVGKYEDPQYAAGTKAVAEAIAFSQSYSVVGGGDTIAAVDQMGLLDKFSFVSTGGGAMLEFLSGRTLPALAILD